MSDSRESSRLLTDRHFRGIGFRVALIILSLLTPLALIRIELETLQRSLGGVSGWLLILSDIYVSCLSAAYLWMISSVAFFEFGLGRRSEGLKREMVDSFSQMMSEYLGGLDLDMSNSQQRDYIASLDRIKGKLLSTPTSHYGFMTIVKSEPKPETIELKLHVVPQYNADAVRIDIQQIDFSKLAAELHTLRATLLQKSETPEHDLEIRELSQAEIALAHGDRAGTLDHLRRVSRWSLDVAQTVGLHVAAEALKSALGL